MKLEIKYSSFRVFSISLQKNYCAYANYCCCHTGKIHIGFAGYNAVKGTVNDILKINQ